MLIDFTVSNFRSIREPVTLSMVEVAPRKGKQKGLKRKRPLLTDEDISPALDVPGWDFKLLRTAGIFGANASGKSNVVRALLAMVRLLQAGADDRAAKEWWLPFRLDSASATLPTIFAFSAVSEPVVRTRIVFRYKLELLTDSVVYEQLTGELSGEEMSFFERTARPGSERVVQFDERLPLGIREVEANLAPNVPLLHMLIRSFDLPGLSGLRTWLRNVEGFGHDEAYLASVATRFHIERKPHFIDQVVHFVSGHDTAVERLEYEKNSDMKRLGTLRSTHRTADGNISWDVREESAGTQRLIDLAGPILTALDDGTLLILDEFGAHLHPHITRRIVELFQNPLTNPKGAQLIFNSQDVTLQANRLLRRDQIWYTVKGAEGNTELFPLSDFKVRNDLAIDQAYLDGRFGAVPFFREPYVGFDRGQK